MGSRASAPLRSIPAWAGEPVPAYPCDTPVAVYPRVGGGTITRCIARNAGTGLSPRGRGNQASAAVSMPLAGSIPAWAGEPVTWRRLALTARVYPRVGGGTRGLICQVMTLEGLSPRGRGNRNVRGIDTEIWGSIPAWAGEPKLA